MNELAFLLDAVPIGPSGGGLSLDMTITFGNVMTFIGMVGMVAVYIIDTRYSASGARGDLKKVAQSVEKLACEVRAHAEEDNQRFEQLRRETGELVVAIRSKVTEVELFARDTFVRRDSFQAALNQQQTLLTSMITDLKAWMARIEYRINKDYRGGESE